MFISLTKRSDYTINYNNVNYTEQVMLINDIDYSRWVKYEEKIYLEGGFGGGSVIFVDEHQKLLFRTLRDFLQYFKNQKLFIHLNQLLEHVISNGHSEYKTSQYGRIKGTREALRSFLYTLERSIKYDPFFPHSFEHPRDRTGHYSLNLSRDELIDYMVKLLLIENLEGKWVIAKRGLDLRLAEKKEVGWGKTLEQLNQNKPVKKCLHCRKELSDSRLRFCYSCNQKALHGE